MYRCRLGLRELGVAVYPADLITRSLMCTGVDWDLGVAVHPADLLTSSLMCRGVDWDLGS